MVPHMFLRAAMYLMLTCIGIIGLYNPAYAIPINGNSWTDDWFKSGWSEANPSAQQHHTSYDDLNVGGQCMARWNPTKGYPTSFLEGPDQPSILVQILSAVAGSVFGDNCGVGWGSKKVNCRIVEDEDLGDQEVCDTQWCACLKPKIYENLCETQPWYNTAQCYTTQKLNDVTWYKACPRGRIVRSSASNHIKLTAKFVGPGRNYDPAITVFETGGINTDNIWLECLPKQIMDINHPAIPQAMKDEWGADFGQPNVENHKKFSLMGCSARFEEGKWNEAVGSSPLLPGKTFGPVPGECMTPSGVIGPELVQFECRPLECDIATLKGCDIPLGIYEFYVSAMGLKGQISDVLEGPKKCPMPPFETSDPRYCGDTGCYKSSTSQECVNDDGNNYAASITKDETNIPEQILVVGSAGVTTGQPVQWIDGSGVTHVEEKIVMINDFKNASLPGVVVNGTRETIYFPDEVPARNGVLVIRGGQEGSTYKIGRAPLQVRSMECPKRADSHMPVQNVTLGQTKWHDMTSFYNQDAQSVLEAAYPNAKPGIPLTGEGDSCDMVETLAKELPSYNILSSGQHGFGMTHSVSTAVNQLLDNKSAKTIPILAVALTEPVRNCIESFNETGNGSNYKNIVWPWLEGVATKWGSNGSVDGTPGKVSSGGRLNVSCMGQNFTDKYATALVDAAKRLRDNGGYVVAIALSCKSPQFLEAMVNTSTAHVNLLNFAPEGVILDDGCKTIVGKNGELDPNKVATQMFRIEADEKDNLLVSPAFAASTVSPLFGTMNDVYAELAWIIVRDQIGQEVCANQAEGACQDMR